MSRGSQKRVVYNNKLEKQRNRFDHYIVRKNENIKNMEKLARINELKEVTLIPEINPHSYKMLAIEA